MSDIDELKLKAPQEQGSGPMDDPNAKPDPGLKPVQTKRNATIERLRVVIAANNDVNTRAERLARYVGASLATYPEIDDDMAALFGIR